MSKLSITNCNLENRLRVQLQCAAVLKELVRRSLSMDIYQNNRRLTSATQRHVRNRWNEGGQIALQLGNVESSVLKVNRLMKFARRATARVQLSRTIRRSHMRTTQTCKSDDGIIVSGLGIVASRPDG